MIDGGRRYEYSTSAPLGDAVQSKILVPSSNTDRPMLLVASTNNGGRERLAETFTRYGVLYALTWRRRIADLWRGQGLSKLIWLEFGQGNLKLALYQVKLCHIKLRS